jgi:hypothetical protein
MSTLVSLFALGSPLLLTLFGLFLMVAPPLGRRILQKTAALAGLFFVFFFALNLVWNLLRSINPLLLIVGVTAVSSVSYFVRERRLRHPARSDGARHAERSPVMPDHIGREDE